MKLKVYQSKTVESEPVVRLALREDDDGDITLMAVDEQGKRKYCGDLLTIASDGFIKRHIAVDPDLGFQLDNNERVLLDTEV